MNENLDMRHPRKAAQACHVELDSAVPNGNSGFSRVCEQLCLGYLIPGKVNQLLRILSVVLKDRAVRKVVFNFLRFHLFYSFLSKDHQLSFVAAPGWEPHTVQCQEPPRF